MTVRCFEDRKIFQRIDWLSLAVPRASLILPTLPAGMPGGVDRGKSAACCKACGDLSSRRQRLLLLIPDPCPSNI